MASVEECPDVCVFEMEEEEELDPRVEVNAAIIKSIHDGSDHFTVCLCVALCLSL